MRVSPPIQPLLQVGVYLQPVGCVLLSALVTGLYRESQGVASSGHFLLLRLVSSRSQPCTSGAILPAGRVGLQPHDCFCCSGSQVLEWAGRLLPLKGRGACAQALFSLVKHRLKGDDTQQISPNPRTILGRDISQPCAFQWFSQSSEYTPRKIEGIQGLISKVKTQTCIKRIQDSNDHTSF